MSLNKLLLLTIYFDVCLRDCAAYQYFFSDQNGGYRYGYNTENGAFATPEGFPNNVLRYNEGHSQGYDRGYITPILTSQSIPPRRPTSRLPPRIPNSNTLNRVMFTLGGQLGISGQADIPYAHRRVNDAAIFGSSPSDKYIPYSFVFNTGNHQREEARDGQGNTQGYFSYTDDLGVHDLRYKANDKEGFQITGGNIALFAVPSEAPNTLFTVGKYAGGKTEQVSKQPVEENGNTEDDVKFYEGADTTDPSE
ncbi:uncharacterized protein LOC143202336 [Rhynchophorus ferrugineus]|uniref:uncharacterized protein LOC143202336 n=1 Tax=Rhynchophorus ferrugineus TaxID=354439 RepID=UPI003FCE4772